jgi:hypothetical protein
MKGWLEAVANGTYKSRRRTEQLHCLFTHWKANHAHHATLTVYVYSQAERVE